jgi:hypothetical protein
LERADRRPTWIRCKETGDHVDDGVGSGTTHPTIALNRITARFRPMLGFKSVASAEITLSGIER